MKKKLRSGGPRRLPKPWMIGEEPAAYGTRMSVSVREAKGRFSELLDRASRGEEIVVTSDGAPKALLTKYRPVISGRPFKPNLDLLRSMPMTPDSTRIIRKERDEGN